MTYILILNLKQSMYFKEPNRILFELAVERSGFDIKEDSNHLGVTTPFRIKTCSD